MAKGDIYIVPANPGVKVRDPQTRGHLPAEGALVPATSYWLRRLIDKDVVVARPPKPAKPEEKSK